MKKLNLIISVLTFITFNSYAQYTKLLDFVGVADGSLPHASFVSDGTFLYGTTSYGGINNKGVIFKIRPDGTEYIKLLDFAGTTNGNTPWGSLVSDGTYLYGMTNGGGSANMGTIFKIMPDGTGYSKLLNFTGTSNGSYPYCYLIYDSTFLYGMTIQGGTNDKGVIFKIKPDGTGYLKLLDFIGVSNGQAPTGGLISDGTFLYGMTDMGGTNNKGVIFKIKPDGTGYIKLLDFAGASNGRVPTGSLISDGTFLYGMTYYGGLNDVGTIFKIMPDGTGYSKLHDFANAADGGSPYGSLIFNGTFLYGMARVGGINGDGTIFKIKPDGTEFTKLLDLDTTIGISPYGSLFSDGTFLYGMTYTGGTNNLGTIFKYKDSTINVINVNHVETDFTIFPNPTNGIFTLTQTNNLKSIKILNILGKEIYCSFINNDHTEINLTSVPKGIYFVKVDNGVQVHVEKIVIN